MRWSNRSDRPIAHLVTKGDGMLVVYEQDVTVEQANQIKSQISNVLPDMRVAVMGGGPATIIYQEDSEMVEEIERLRRWKSEATVVMAEMEKAWGDVGMPGELGQSHAIAMRDEIKRLRLEVSFLQADARMVEIADDTLITRPTLQLQELWGLVIEWADAYDAWDGRNIKSEWRWRKATKALRKAVGR